HYNLGCNLRTEGDLNGAITALREAVRLKPKAAEAHNNLGSVLLDKRDLDGAADCFRKAIRLNPKLARAHYNLGLGLGEKGEVGAAITSFQAELRLYPKLPQAHNALAYLLAAGPGGVRDGKQAVKHATRACELTDWKAPDPIATLAAAHA